MASSPLFDCSTGLKKDVPFSGVFKETKLSEVTSAEVATFSKTSYPQLVMVSGGEMTLASHFVTCDHEKYIAAAKGSISEIIAMGMSNFKKPNGKINLNQT